MDQRYGTEVWTERVFRELIIWLAPIHTYIYIYICVCFTWISCVPGHCEGCLFPRVPIPSVTFPLPWSAVVLCSWDFDPWQQEKWRCWWWTRSWLHWKPCRHMFGKIFAQYAFIHIHTSSIKEWRYEPGLAIWWCANMYIALIPAV